MFPRSTDLSLRIVGIALEGSDGVPVVVLESRESGALLPLPVGTFGADAVVRDFLGELETGDESCNDAISWLADLLAVGPPRSARVETVDGEYRVRFRTGRFSRGRDRLLPLGEGIVLCRRLDIPLTAGDDLVDTTRRELQWLSSSGAFLGDFLYLSPPQYAPDIPLE